MEAFRKRKEWREKEDRSKRISRRATRRGEEDER